jgi:hypothetical protein
MYKETANITINCDKIRTPSRKPRVIAELTNNKPNKSDLIGRKVQCIAK